ncbi:hypothetical protein [Streptomyces sp. NPDC086787]|uniref:hypothetical protein n=1 Tax=Streptomyces sp. NPDC086787 TaxID=3365759 RepID=UPI0037F5748D
MDITKAPLHKKAGGDIQALCHSSATHLQQSIVTRTGHTVDQFPATHTTARPAATAPQTCNCLRVCFFNRRR